MCTVCTRGELCAQYAVRKEALVGSQPDNEESLISERPVWSLSEKWLLSLTVFMYLYFTQGQGICAAVVSCIIYLFTMKPHAWDKGPYWRGYSKWEKQATYIWSETVSTTQSENNELWKLLAQKIWTWRQRQLFKVSHDHCKRKICQQDDTASITTHCKK